MDTYLNFDKLFLSNHSEKFLRFSLQIRSVEVRSHRVNCARNDLYFANQREDIFHFPHPPTSRTGPPQTIPPSPGPKGWTCPWSYRVGMITSQIGLFINVLANCRYIHVCCMEINTLPIRYLL